MAGSRDDIIVLGGARRRLGHERDEAIEELFSAECPRLVRSAFAVLGDAARARQVAVAAFFDLWLHWRRVGDAQAAPQYLTVAATSLVTKAAAAVPAAGSALETPGGRAPAPAHREINDPPDVDIDGAWGEFEALREHRGSVRRRGLKALAAIATAAAVSAAFLALANRGHAGHAPRALRQPVGMPARYPGAIVARYSLSGVISVVGDAARAWAIRQIPQASTVVQPALATSYQLVALDLRTSAVLYRVRLGAEPRAIAAGAGRLWLTTSASQAAGQIERIDPASGRVVQILHLRAGRCTQLSFTPGHLYAACQATGPAGTEFWKINPATGRAVPLAGPVRSSISSLIAVPDALWYVADYSRITGLSRFTGRPIAVRPKRVTASDPGFQYAPPGSQDLAYDAGSIWALGQSEQLARIDAITGKVVRRYGYRDYDPTRAGGLDYLTAAGGWLWFLDNGYPFSGVLRVSQATGRPDGGVPIPPDSCGQVPCSLIFATPGSIWVPTAQLLLRIDRAALPAGPVTPFGEPVNHPDADSRLPG